MNFIKLDYSKSNQTSQYLKTEQHIISEINQQKQDEQLWEAINELDKQNQIQNTLITLKIQLFKLLEKFSDNQISIDELIQKINKVENDQKHLQQQIKSQSNTKFTQILMENIYKCVKEAKMWIKQINNKNAQKGEITQNESKFDQLQKQLSSMKIKLIKFENKNKDIDLNQLFLYVKEISENDDDLEQLKKQNKKLNDFYKQMSNAQLQKLIFKVSKFQLTMFKIIGYCKQKQMILKKEGRKQVNQIDQNENADQSEQQKYIEFLNIFCKIRKEQKKETKIYLNKLFKQVEREEIEKVKWAEWIEEKINEIQ